MNGHIWEVWARVSVFRGFGGIAEAVTATYAYTAAGALARSKLTRTDSSGGTHGSHGCDLAPETCTGANFMLLIHTCHGA